MIDSATDIKIFIEYNKSNNMVVTKEKFQQFVAKKPKPVAKPYPAEDPATGFAFKDNLVTKKSQHGRTRS